VRHSYISSGCRSTARPIPYVEEEVERALFAQLAKDDEMGSRLINDYALALKLLAPERTDRISRLEFESHRGWIRHMHDIPAARSTAAPGLTIASNETTNVCISRVVLTQDQST